MDDAPTWTMDEVAARTLLLGLGLEATAERLALASGQLARHRHAACGWAAERLHDAIVSRLEQESTERFGHHDAAWTDGFRAAEHVVMTLRPTQLLDMELPPARSRGELLRAMVRQARQADLPLVVKAER